MQIKNLLSQYNIYSTSIVTNNTSRNTGSTINDLSNSQEYILNLSKESKKLNSKNSNLDNNNINPNEHMLQSQAETFMLDRKNAKISAKNQNTNSDVINQCIKIANSISKGDKVSKKDEDFLQKYASGMYTMALSLRQQKEDPKENNSISKEPKFEKYITSEEMDFSSININIAPNNSNTSNTSSISISTSSISTSEI